MSVEGWSTADLENPAGAAGDQSVSRLERIRAGARDAKQNELRACVSQTKEWRSVGILIYLSICILYFNPSTFRRRAT